jgi:hypothetical protein
MTVGELPLYVRAAFYVALLGALALAELLSDRFYWPLAVLAGFLLGVLPAIARVFGRERGPMPSASGRVVVGFAAVLTLLTAIEVALIPDLGLSAIFWIVAIVIPSFEVLGYLARREARRR